MVEETPRAEDTAPLRFAPRASSSSSPEKNVVEANDARTVRDDQLRDLLNTLGMTRKSSSSSTTDRTTRRRGCEDGWLGNFQSQTIRRSRGGRGLSSEQKFRRL